jgi:hypothetical protein
MTTLRSAARVRIAALLFVAGCLGGGEQEPPADWESFEQTIDLDFDGSGIPVPLDGMDVWLTEDDSEAERWVIHGAGTSFGGSFPHDVRIGYEDNWNVLVGRAITISPRHMTIDGETASTLTVPGVGRVDVVGGQFIIEKVDPDWDARTPISGRIELQVHAATGLITLHGRLAVKGTGWG